MSTPTARQIAVPITSAAVVAGMMFTAAPAGAAVTTTPFTNTCKASSVIAVDKSSASSVTVDAPGSVEVGDTFTYRIQPGGSSYPNTDSGATTTNLSRFKLDYDIPANSTFVSAAVVPGTGINLDGVAPSVIRVNSAGAADAGGSILRVSGNNEVVANGASNSTNAEGGIRAPKLKKNLDGTTTSDGSSWFRLPAIDVTVTANAPGVIEPKIRTSGNAGTYNNNENYYTFLAKASFLGTQWAPTKCTPRDSTSGALNAGAGALATITVNDPGPNVEDTTTTLAVPATAKTGTAVDLTASVVPAGATGTVEFKDGATSLGTAPVNSGTATLNHTFTTDGSHSITAVYSGDATHNPSTSAAGTVDVSTDPVVVDTTTTLTVPATAKTGTAVDLTASVAPADATGTVQFKDGNADIGAPVPVTGGTATLNHTFTTTGAHSITAAYSGDATNHPSTSAASTVDVSVNVLDTTTTLTAPATAKTGTAVDLTATVAPADATGTVEFKDGATSLGTAPVNAGVATLSHTFTTTGNHDITAVYSGAEGFATSTSAVSAVDVSVNMVDTTTTLNVPGEATTGEAVDLWALVTGPDNAPAAGGTVQFRIDGSDVGGAITLVDGGAKLTHTFTGAGSHTVSAVFSGSQGFNGSTGGSQTVNVTDPTPVEVATVTTLSAPASATKGDAVNLTATVRTEGGDNVTTGTVRFFDGATPIGEAVDVVGGQAVLPYAFGETGARQITAVYTGATGFTESTSAAATVNVTEATDPGTPGGGSLENIFGS